MRRIGRLALIAIGVCAVASPAPGPAVAAGARSLPRSLEFRFTPTTRNQIAIWIEKADGTFMGTVRLTQAVSVRGIGNRPGAAQMNSAFRWPYGRREGALPIWAHRRAAGPGATPFKRIVFQNRPEGFASTTVPDSSTESYFCLSFTQRDLSLETRRKEALDAVSCATQFNSDKGRFLRNADVSGGYAEPAEIDGQGIMRPLDAGSLYPPRRDVTPCTGSSCLDGTDVVDYVQHARQVMPDLDAVTMATPPTGVEQSILFTMPDSWGPSDYVAFIEVNVEGDYNRVFNGDYTNFDGMTLRTPRTPAGAWDSWAMDFGYPYRGQPSVVFKVPFTVAAAAASTSFSTIAAFGYGDVDGFGEQGGVVHPMDGRITNDAANQVDAPLPGSGADRLTVSPTSDYRFKVTVVGTENCQELPPPQAPAAMDANPTDNPKHSHEWGRLHFVVPQSSRPIDHYDVRYSTTEITSADPTTFTKALPAMAAETDSVGLMVPTAGAPGSAVEVAFGGMQPRTRYWIAVRAVDSCNVAGPFAVAALTTTQVNFTRLSGCFVATAAYGSPLQPEVEVLRTLRDELRARSVLFAAATDIYYRAGPAAASVLSRSDAARAMVRSALGPVAAVARATVPLLRPVLPGQR